MSSQQIPSLLTPANVQQSRQKVLDIVNSKFSSLEDLQDLEEVVEDAQSRKDQLEQKLSLSQEEIDKLIGETRSLAEEHLGSAQELSLLRHSLADEISYLSQGFMSYSTDGEKKSTLLDDIETLHRNLKELQTVKDYVQVIQRALQLSESAITQFHSAKTLSPASLTEYKSLNEFVFLASQISTQVGVNVEEKRPRLVTFLEETRDKTWANIKNFLIEKLLSAAEVLRWPMPIDYATVRSENRNTFERAFSDLLRLQSLGEAIQTPNFGARKETDGLYALQALVQPISLRFRYHFEGTRQTNRLDKPEWYFTHVLNAAHEHRSFMDVVIQPLLSSTKYRGIDAWNEFVLLLLPLLTHKLKRTVPSLLSHPSLLAHTVYQSLAFDAAILGEGFTLLGTSAKRSNIGESKVTDESVVENWPGVSEVILGKKEWFDEWLAGEKKFTEDQYLEIISDPAAWVIADDESSDDTLLDKDFRTTNSARRIKALVEQVTDRYAPLPDFTSRTRFLISVQLPVLELYHSRISSSLDAFETLSSVFVRAVPGALGVNFGEKEEGRVNVDTSRLTGGVDGVQRLCKALVSAKFLQLVLTAWGEEVFFLELWAEINHRASLRDAAKGNLSLPDPRVSEIAIPEDTIFEELVAKYSKLVKRSEDMIVQQVCGETESSLKPHFAALSSSNEPAQESGIVLSHTLLAPVALLSSHLSFLRSVLSQTTLVALYRRISSRLADHIFQREILHRGPRQIDLRNGNTLLAEYELWMETCHAALNGIPRSRVEAPWTMLLQAGRLLSIEGEARDSLMDTTFGVGPDEEWEKTITEVVGVRELARESVANVLRARGDCDC